MTSQVSCTSSMLSDIIKCKIKDRGLTFDDFKKLCDAVLIREMPTSYHLSRRRSQLMRTIFGQQELSFNKFKLIMCDILGETV